MEAGIVGRFGRNPMGAVGIMYKERRGCRILTGIVSTPSVAHVLQCSMIEIRQTAQYRSWHSALRDRVARARIDVRIRRLALGNAGDVKPVGNGVSELRIDHGPGYRVYFVRRGVTVIVLLAGGDKRTQDQDIQIALELASMLKE
jgi:putative addiction module killer protein